MRRMVYILTIVAIVLLVAPARFSAQVRSTGQPCPNNIVSEYDAISKDAQRLGGRGRIVAVNCQTVSIGSYIDHVIVVADDGRRMIWRPDDGTRALTRMLQYGQ